MDWLVVDPIGNVKNFMFLCSNSRIEYVQLDFDSVIEVERFNSLRLINGWTVVYHAHLHSGSAIEIIFWLENEETAATAADYVRHRCLLESLQWISINWKENPSNGQFFIKIMPSRQLPPVVDVIVDSGHRSVVCMYGKCITALNRIPVVSGSTAWSDHNWRCIFKVQSI